MEKYSPEEPAIVMTRDEVRAFDSWAINEAKVPGVVLMENAGRSCTELIKDKLSGSDEAKVCIFCGTGNNGGDGYVIARGLVNSGFKVLVVICGDRDRIKGDAKINLDILEKIGGPIEQLNMNDSDIAVRIKEFAADAELIVDAVFGTGLSGEVRGGYILLIESINSLQRCVLAVDIPSGLDCDTGEPLGAAIKASYTVTFVAVKKGFAISKTSRRYTGDVYVASIGVVPALGFKLRKRPVG